MVAVVAPESAGLALNTLSARGMHAWIAGEVGEMQGLHGAILEGSYQAR
jgi:phosphoribosylaminoimidazole (AIR) synthetase